MIKEMQRKRDEIMNGEMGLLHRFIQFVSTAKFLLTPGYCGFSLD